VIAAPASDLRLAGAAEPVSSRLRTPEPPPPAVDPSDARSLGGEVSAAPRVMHPGDEWSLGADPADAARPVERPAYSGERARAAALDLALLTVLWAVVGA